MPNNLLESEIIFSAPLYVTAIILIAVIVLIAIFLDEKTSKFDTRSISYAGIAVALTVVLSLVKIFTLPQGGTVTLASLLPLLIYSFNFGTKKGVIAGAIAGIIICLIDPYVIHPAQFALDYPIAFGAIGLTGMLNKTSLKKKRTLSFILGAFISSIIRFICHVLSGVFAFASYSTMNATLIYSLTYNSFVFVDIALAVIIGAILISSKRLQAVFSPVIKTPPENSDGNNDKKKINRK